MRNLKVKNYHFLLMFTAVTVAITGYGIVIPLLPTIKTSYEIGPFGMGMVLSIFALGQFVGAPFMGDFNYRFGEKRVLMIGLLGFAVTTFLTLLFSNFMLLLAFRFLSGICSTSILVATEIYTATKFDKKYTTRFISLLSVASAIGMGIGLFIGQISLMSNGILISLPIAIFVGIVLLLDLLILFVLPNTEDAHKDAKLDEVTKFTSYFTTLFKEIYVLSKSKTVLFILYGFFIFGYTTSGLEAFGFDYVKTSYSFTKGPILLTIGLTLLFIVFYFFKLHPYFEEKLEHLNLLIFYAAKSCVLLALLFFFKSIYIFIPALMLLLVTISIFSSILITFVSEISDNPKLILGTKNSIVSIGIIMGPIMGGIFYEMKPTYLFLQLSLSFLIIIIMGVSLSLYHKNRDKKKEALKI